MSEELPLVSIVTPSFNQGRFIEDTILSVKNQDYRNTEHIIVDGGSSDNTLEILKQYEGTYNMRWISEPDEGQSDAINKGFRMVKGEIVGWLNSDDVYFDKTVISYIVELFRKIPDADIMFGGDASIDVDNCVFRVRKLSHWSYNKLLRGFSISQPATFFQRNVIIENQLRTDLDFVMDFEFWLRLGKEYNFCHANRILAGNRLYRMRKSMSAGQQITKERRAVMHEFGQTFSVKYYLLRYLYDLPLSKLFAMIDILRTEKESDNLAFRGYWKPKHKLIFTQLVPLSWLRL